MNSENDVFLNAPLTGQEDDFLEKIRRHVQIRHGGLLDPRDVISAYKVN